MVDNLNKECSTYRGGNLLKGVLISLEGPLGGAVISVLVYSVLYLAKF